MDDYCISSWGRSTLLREYEEKRLLKKILMLNILAYAKTLLHIYTVISVYKHLFIYRYIYIWNVEDSVKKYQQSDMDEESPAETKSSA